MFWDLTDVPREGKMPTRSFAGTRKFAVAHAGFEPPYKNQSVLIGEPGVTVKTPSRGLALPYQFDWDVPAYRAQKRLLGAGHAH